LRAITVSTIRSRAGEGRSIRRDLHDVGVGTPVSTQSGRGRFQV
jgi:hypothetical protein